MDDLREDIQTLVAMLAVQHASTKYPTCRCGRLAIWDYGGLPICDTCADGKPAAHLQAMGVPRSVAALHDRSLTRLGGLP